MKGPSQAPAKYPLHRSPSKLWSARRVGELQRIIPAVRVKIQLLGILEAMQF